MNKDIIRSATILASNTANRSCTSSNDQYMEVFINKFAEILANDIISVVGYHAIKNDTATDVFVNLKRIYCNAPLVSIE